VRRLTAEPEGDGHFAGGSQRHAALLTGSWSHGTSGCNKPLRREVRYAGPAR
jgi:hypothetical protein